MWPTQADLHAMVHFDLTLHTIPSVFDARQHGQRPFSAVPKLGSCASSGFLAAPHSGARQGHWAPSHCLGARASRLKGRQLHHL